MQFALSAKARITGQESMSGTSVIRDILWLVLPSGDACPAVDGVDIHQYVRVSDFSVYVAVYVMCVVCVVTCLSSVRVK